MGQFFAVLVFNLRWENSRVSTLLNHGEFPHFLSLVLCPRIHLLDLKPCKCTVYVLVPLLIVCIDTIF